MTGEGTAAEAAPAPAVAGTARGAFLRRYGADSAFVTLLVATNLFIRWVTLEPIENGGDPLDAWFFVRQWLHGNDFSQAGMSHHSTRFGMHFITWIVQRVCGTHPHFYYIPQLFASGACVALTYLLGRQLHGKLVGVVAALWLIDLPLFHPSSCQLRRGIFETMYTLATLNCVARYLDQTTEPGQRRWLIAASVCACLGYFVELPALYFTPGIVLAIWLARRKLRHILIFAAILLAFFLLETAGYALITRYSSRFAVLEGPHGQLGLIENDPGVPFSYLLERFTGSRDPTKLIYYPFFLAAPFLIWRAKPKPRLVALAALGFAFLMTFVVRSVSPIIVFEDNHDRYLLQGMPPAMVANLIALLEVAALLRKKLGDKPLSGLSWVGRHANVAGAVAFAAALLWLTTDAWGQQAEPHAIDEVDRTYALLNDALRRGLPIVGEADRQGGAGPNGRARTLHWAVKGFVRDEFLASGDQLANFSYGKTIAQLDAKHRYFPASMAPEAVAALDADGCAVRLLLRGSFVKVMPKGSRLPARCGRSQH